MPILLRPALLLALLPLAACNFWIIPIPVPLGTRTAEPVPAATVPPPPVEERPSGR
jgi:hypothetical protein